jgi:AcrR family transcriptional regulator
MDRRQRKTRQAIFSAFTELLGKKDFDCITVEQIIKKADIGRATFYAHFETKDYLLKELCDELFCHIFDSSEGNERAHTHIFECEAPDSVFLHLFMHLKNNDNHIKDLLMSSNNQLFLQYFKKGVKEISKRQISLLTSQKTEQIPTDFLIEHMANTFISTVAWWAENGMQQTPQKINEYFMAMLNFAN